MGNHAVFDDPDDQEVRELRGIWLSRLMFNEFVGWPRETRTYEEFCAAYHSEQRDG